MGSNSLPEGHYLPTGIKVLISGCGVAGLWCALECVRNGHSPLLLESRPTCDPAGDFFGIMHTATDPMKWYPELYAAFKSVAWDTWTSYHKPDGKMEVPASPLSAKTFGKVFLRADMAQILTDEVQRRGIEIRYNSKVINYFETAEHGGVVLENGERLMADVVVAADGLHSRSWKLVVGTKEEPSSSGNAIYRAAYPLERALQDPVYRNYHEKDDVDGRDRLRFLVGPSFHGMTMFNRKQVCWVMMHQDDPSTSTESWSQSLDPSLALSKITDLGATDPILHSLIRSTPPGGLIDWQLKWRNPQPKWTSSHGRVVQMGDAAHTFLPSSANGATQAMEDAISFATCLRLAATSRGGKDEKKREIVALATRVHNRLRFARTSCAQLTGVTRMQKIRAVDWEAAKTDPKLATVPIGKWIWNHDPEAYAVGRFDECAEAVEGGEHWDGWNEGEEGAGFRNTNIPEGYRLRKWGIKDMMERVSKGMIEVEGDWD